MEFRLLGPFDARDGNTVAAIGTRRQERHLLAILLLDPGRVVTTDRLIEWLWGGAPPHAARAAVHTYVGRLRRSLEPFGVRLRTEHDGYAFEPDQHWVDVQDFRALVRLAAASTDPAERVDFYGRAMALWRGPLLADLVDDSARCRWGADLGDLRLAAAEEWAEGNLTQGRHAYVVEELAPLVAAHPTRERLAGQLMTALYRSERRADALDTYRATAGALVADFGVQPGPQLRRLHQRILSADPSLDRPAGPVYAVRVSDEWLPWATSGHPALEFCNTFAGWPEPDRFGSDWLRSYTTLAVWAGHLDLADPSTVSYLLKMADRDPEGASTALTEARDLRDALYACLTVPDDVRAFTVVAEHAECAAKVAQFRPSDSGLGRWRVSLAARLRLPARAVALSAAELLADPRRRGIRACGGQRCGWLFLDASGRRRWCSVATCGGECR